METKLTDFDSKELQTLLDIVVYRILEEDEHKKEWIKTFGNSFFTTEDEAHYDEVQRPLRSTNYEHLCLWRTQILNAIGKVRLQEEINSN